MEFLLVGGWLGQHNSAVSQPTRQEEVLVEGEEKELDI